MTRGPAVLLTLIAAVFAGSYWARQKLSHPAAATRAPLGPPQRIVSLAPSITEVLFALDLGPRVVGVTRYCQYPPEARQRPNVGGHLDPNLEALVALQPDLVVLPAGSQQNHPDFARLGLTMLAVDHRDLDGTLDSITELGRICGVEAQAERLLADIQTRLQRVQRAVADRPRPTVLFAVQRTLGLGTLQDVYVAGSDRHIDRLLTLAGGRNAYQGTAPFPVLTAEGILQLNPDVIVDNVPALARRTLDHREILADWQAWPQLQAVAAGRVYLLEEEYITIPGPRFILVVEKLARLLHPEAFAAQHAD